MYEQDYGQSEAKAARVGALGALDEELERLAKVSDALTQRLSSISTQHALIDTVAEPRPAPTTALRERIERLGNLTTAIERMMHDLDL